MAQSIIPDNSLSNPSSLTTAIAQGQTTSLITGGQDLRIDGVLHRFQAFNVSLGERVYFSPAPTVKVIVGQVIGDRPSHIAGTLGVIGTADLFLINPAGVVFGAGGSLDLSGAFLGNTGTSLLFRSVSDDAPTREALLTVNMPLGLTLEGNEVAKLKGDPMADLELMKIVCELTQANQLVVVGRGGLPSMPDSLRSGVATWDDLRLGEQWATLTQGLAEESSSPMTTLESPETATMPLVQAQTWVRDPQGVTTLVAIAPTSAGLLGQGSAENLGCLNLAAVHER